MKKIGQVCILGLLGISIANAYNEKNSWRVDTDLYVLSDDNVNRAEEETDQIDDRAAGVFVSAYYAQSFSRDNALIYSIELESRAYDKWDGASNTELSAGLEYRIRTRQGFTAPLYSVSVAVSGIDYKSTLRDGSKAKIDLSVFKRLTDKVSISSGIGGSVKDADSDIFDIEQARFFVVADISLVGTSSLYLQYQYLDGDVVSSAMLTSKLLAARTYWEAWGADDAFSNSAISRSSYRFDATTSVIELGLTLGINSKNSIQVAVDSYDSTSKAGNINYTGMRARVDYLTRF